MARQCSEHALHRHPPFTFPRRFVATQNAARFKDAAAFVSSRAMYVASPPTPEKEIPTSSTFLFSGQPEQTGCVRLWFVDGYPRISFFLTLPLNLWLRMSI